VSFGMKPSRNTACDGGADKSKYKGMNSVRRSESILPPQRRARRPLAAALSCAALLALPATAAAHTLNASDTAHLHPVKTSGALLVEEGEASGGLPGKVKVSFRVGPTVTSYFTIYPKGGGSIVGHGSGSLHSSGNFASFGGSLTITGGTGRYTHAHGSSSGLYGVLERRTDDLTVQTTGKLYY
jgi:hypothetical protein